MIFRYFTNKPLCSGTLLTNHCVWVQDFGVDLVVLISLLQKLKEWKKGPPNDEKHGAMSACESSCQVHIMTRQCGWEVIVRWRLHVPQVFQTTSRSTYFVFFFTSLFVVRIVL